MRRNASSQLKAPRVVERLTVGPFQIGAKPFHWVYNRSAHKRRYRGKEEKVYWLLKVGTRGTTLQLPASKVELRLVLIGFTMDYEQRAETSSDLRRIIMTDMQKKLSSVRKVGFCLCQQQQWGGEGFKQGFSYASHDKVAQ